MHQSIIAGLFVVPLKVPREKPPATIQETTWLISPTQGLLCPKVMSRSSPTDTYFASGSQCVRDPKRLCVLTVGSLGECSSINTPGARHSYFLMPGTEFCFIHSVWLTYKIGFCTLGNNIIKILLK